MSFLSDGEKENSYARPESVVPCDLDNAFAELVEEIEIDWPEFLPTERIRPRITVAAFVLLLVVGLSQPSGPSIGAEPPRLSKPRVTNLQVNSWSN